MKSENILEALNDIDHDMVEDAEEKRKKSKKSIILKWSALAACLILVVGLVLEMLPPPIPVYENAMYSAAEIAKMLEREYAGPTSAYEKIYAPGKEYLSLESIPDSKYLTIYNCVNAFEFKKALDEEEFADFFADYLPEVAQVLGIWIPEYSIKTHTSTINADIVKYSGSKKYGISGIQYPLYNKISFSGNQSVGVNPTGEVFLDGQRLEIDQSQSDADILASLEWAKEKLFAIFNVSFSDAKIIREYNNYDNYENTSGAGATSVVVYFYNMADNPLNTAQKEPLSDHIRIYFDNIMNHKDDAVSDTIIWDAGVSYIQYREAPAKVYSPVAKVRVISLTEAEELLFKGYVFGGHSCPVCMEGQKKVDFSNYDFVGFEYVYGKLDENDSQYLPFYAFSKKIGIDKNGNTVSARTYVPAFEVSGYEEYFKSQEAAHRS